MPKQVPLFTIVEFPDAALGISNIHMIEHETNVEAIDQACRLSPRAGPTGKNSSLNSRILLTRTA